MKSINISKLLTAAMLLVLAAASCSYSDISAGKATDNGPLIRGFEPDKYGYAVWDIENSRLVMDHNLNADFIPASVTKLMTALFALEVLGKDYVFKTEILYTGSISDGIVTGDLYIRGGGDPELSVYALSRLAAALKEKNIRGINGNFYFDDSALAPEVMLDPNMPGYAPYNCGISGLNLNSNTVLAVRRNDRSGNSFTYTFLPPADSIAAVKYDDKPVFPYVSYRFASGRETWLLPSKRILDARHELPVKNTGSFTAWTFYRLCMERGIRLKAPVRGTTPGGAKNLCSHESRPLSEIVPDMLKTSDNLTAEVLGRLAAQKYSGSGNMQMNFVDATAHFYSREFSKVEWDSMSLFSASGLASFNRLSPAQVLAVLIAISRDFEPESILSMSGENGTLRSRFDTPDYAYRIYAKTGSIYYCSSLAGVFYASSGRKYLFTVFINDKAARHSFDSKKIKDVYDSVEAEKWYRRASEGIDDFMTGIISSL